MCSIQLLSQYFTVFLHKIDMYVYKNVIAIALSRYQGVQINTYSVFFGKYQHYVEHNVLKMS